jgi:cysteine desulfurase
MGKMDLIYLDNNATTKPCDEAVAAMHPYLTEWYGNPSSVHRFGQRSRQAVDEARGRVASLVGAAEAEIVFTGGGTESINAAVRGMLGWRAPRRRIVTSAVEHSAMRELGHQLTREGLEVVEVGVDRAGRLDWDGFVGALNDTVAAVSLMWANNETGVLFPVDRIAAACRERGIPFHCDATQAVGKIPVDLRAVGVDVASFASHKFHGPKGVGAMYARKGLRLRPPLIIGGPQERGRRGGTENVPGIVGMGAAAEVAVRCLPDISRVAQLRDNLERRILADIPGTSVNGDTSARLPNTTNISFPQLEAEAILLLLSEQGICASAGAACSSGSLEPSHVLRAMDIEPKVAHGAIRFSLSRLTTQEEIDEAMEVLPAIIERLRRVLPVGA